MDLKDSLPESVVRLIQATTTAEFSTLNAAGTPIDTPLLCFPAEDLSSINMATGLAYPAKAERVRRNPKVGLLIEGLLPGEPVVSIAGMAAVRDRDIQANMLEYIAETGLFGDQSVPWSEQRRAVWYWSRIIMTIAPKQVFWWDSPGDLDQAPHRWDAPAETTFPASDPAPAGTPSRAPKWTEHPWRDLANGAIERGGAGHLSLVDEDGFPRPMRARNVRLIDDGLSLELPRGVPGRRSGPASLTFAGRETFIGQVSADGSGGLWLKVDRALPILPLVSDPNEVWNPSPATREALMSRLKTELERRNQSTPAPPLVKPQPTAGSLRRAAREARLAALAGPGQ